jgi:methionyl-tRNA formyltransferase
VVATGLRVIAVDTPEQLAAGAWQAEAPRYLFFTHWSHRIPPEVFERHECIVFHMAELPQGRGGSPIQNQIVRGQETTSLCALRCVAGMDAGPVYLRRPMSLLGSLDEILQRAARQMISMILEIVERAPQPQPQVGEPTVFRRRTPAEGDLSPLATLEQVFDHIRMLDGQSYPPAFLETEHLRLEFSRASLKDGHVIADVRIRLKPTP